MDEFNAAGDRRIPVMNEADYLNAITKSIDEKRALVLKDSNILVGAMAFSDQSAVLIFWV